MTIKEFLATAQPQISPHSTHPRQDLNEFLSVVLGIKPEDVVMHPEMRISDTALNSLDALVSRQILGEPHAKVAGFTEFCGHKIQLKHDVLIPRPETEQLVELALKNLPEKEDIRILEIGVGSGCIASSITLDLFRKGVPYSYIGIDPSEEAILNTKLNLETLLDVTLEEENDRNKIKNESITLIKTEISNLQKIPNIDVIISNPPYLNQMEMKSLDSSVADHEPAQALDGGEDGTTIYSQIDTYISSLKKPPILFLEISPTIALQLESIFRTQYGEKVFIVKDYFGEERFLLCG